MKLRDQDTGEELLFTFNCWLDRSQEDHDIARERPVHKKNDESEKSKLNITINRMMYYEVGYCKAFGAIQYCHNVLIFHSEKYVIPVIKAGLKNLKKCPLAPRDKVVGKAKMCSARQLMQCSMSAWPDLFNPNAADLFVSIFHSFEAGIAKEISSFK